MTIIFVLNIYLISGLPLLVGFWEPYELFLTEIDIKLYYFILFILIILTYILVFYYLEIIKDIEFFIPKNELKYDTF